MKIIYKPFTSYELNTLNIEKLLSTDEKLEEEKGNF